MIGGGGSTANRAAADVIGGDAGAAAAELAPADGEAAAGRASIGLLAGRGALDPPAADDVVDASDALGAIDAFDAIAGDANDDAIGDGLAALTAIPPAVLAAPLVAPPMAPMPPSSGRISFGPRKSLTRVSTSWLIEMWLVSQNAFSRSYVVRLTLMLRRVCFLAMIHPYATGRVSSRRTY